MSIPNVDLRDTFDQWRIKTNEIGETVGDLALLTTTEDDDIVTAINEIVTRSIDIGVLADLDTSYVSNLVGAINEINSNTDQNTTNIELNDAEITVIEGKITTRIPYSQDSLNDYGNAGSGIVLDAELYDSYVFTCDFSPLIITENIPIGRSIDLIMINAGSATITWPTGTIWAGAPTFTTSGTDMVRLTRISGAIILGSVIGLNYA